MVSAMMNMYGGGLRVVFLLLVMVSVKQTRATGQVLATTRVLATEASAGDRASAGNQVNGDY